MSHDHSHPHDHSHDPSSHEYVEGGAAFIEPVVAATGVNVADLDPQNIAPTLVVVNEARMGDPGHGAWTLPLIGGQRPYVYEMVFDGGTKRAFTDTLVGLLSVLIDGYDELAAARARQEAADPDSVASSDARIAALDARTAFLRGARQTLQKRSNDRARRTGAWAAATDLEREQAALGETAQTPVGILTRVALAPELGDAQWDPTDPDVIAEWESNDVPLYVNLGEYDVLGDPSLPHAPHCAAPLIGSDGVQVTSSEGYIVVDTSAHPKALPVLNPATDETFILSLDRHGFIQLTERPVTLPDKVFADALAAGAAAAAEGN